MAGTKVNNYSNIDTNIQALQLTTDKVFKGLHQLTLTEMNTTTVPAIAAGSVVECNGTLIKYDTEEAIVTTDPHTSATVTDGAVYIVIKGADLTAYFTATAPTWSDAKQGYYGTTTWANDRYVGRATKASTIYNRKNLIKNQEETKTKISAAISGSSGASETTLTLTEILDTNGELSSNTITLKKTGYYLFNISAYVYSNHDYYTYAYLRIYKGGSIFKNIIGYIINNYDYAALCYSDVLYFNAGDILQLKLYGNNTSLTKYIREDVVNNISIIEL